MGGALAIATIATFDVFDGACPFYGVPDLTKFDLGNIRCKVFAQFGDLDRAKGFSDPETAKNLENSALRRGVDFKLKIWENADHAFMNQDSPNYNSHVAEEAIIETCDFFNSCNPIKASKGIFDFCCS